MYLQHAVVGVDNESQHSCHHSEILVLDNYISTCFNHEKYYSILLRCDKVLHDSEIGQLSVRLQPSQFKSSKCLNVGREGTCQTYDP